MELTWAGKLEMKGLEKGRSEGRNEGLQQGRNKGLRQGRDEGKLEGYRHLLLTVLAERFGELPRPLRRRLESEDALDRLEALSRRALTARSLEELDWS